MKNNLSLVYNFNGRIGIGYENSSESLRIAEESGDLYSKIGAYASHGYSCYFRGHLEEAQEFCLRAVGLFERISFLVPNVMAHETLADLYFELGKYDKSEDHYMQGVHLLEQSNTLPSWHSLLTIGSARAQVARGDGEIELAAIPALESNIKVRLYVGRAGRYLAEIFLNVDDLHMSEAEESINKAIAVDNRNGLRWELGQDYALCAELFKRKGDLSKTSKMMTIAIDTLKECGAEGWVKRYEKELARL